ncbi:MAG: methyltransferase domain-containing protein [Candidatus Hodarchaeota archaeon]
MSPFGGEIHSLRGSLIERLFLMVFGSWHTGARIRAFHILRLASKHIRAGSNVLDAGCGLGRHAFSIARKYPNVSIVGVDLSGENISICNGIRKKNHLEAIRFHKGDLRFLDLDRRFDVIICSDVLEYIEEDKRVLDNFGRLLKKNGRLILHAPRLNPRRYLSLFERYFRCDPREKAAHAREGYTDSQLREKLRKSGLTIASLRYTFGHLGSLSWELSKIIERFKPLFVLCFPLILFLGYVDSFKTNREGNGLLIEAQQS